MQKFCLYRRVSTQRQSDSGLSFEAQQTAIDNYLAKQIDYEVVGSFTEVETGTNKRKRPKLREALEVCKKENATLVVASLTRLARNVHFISGLVESKVAFIALDMPNMDKTMAYFMSIMAEWEADVISKRVKDALKEARKVKVLGKTHKTNFFTENALSKRAEARIRTASKAASFAAKIKPTLSYFLGLGLTSPKIANELNNLGIATPSGRGKWHPTQVNRCLKRASVCEVCIGRR